MKNTVCISAADSYDIDNLKKLVSLHMDSLGFAIEPGMTVVIKPNLIMRADPVSGIITHPAMTAAVGLCVQDRGGKVLIAESSGGPFTPMAMRAIFKGCGYTDMAEKYGFSLYLDCKSSSVELKDAQLCHRLSVLDPFLQADCIISLAKLKSHCMTMFSGAVKNLFGTVPGLMKPELHCRFPDKADFAKMLVDLCEYVRPSFSIIDAVEAMEGNGPTGGNMRAVGCIISSKSPYAADFAGSSIANMNPENVFYLRNAMDRGLCPKTPGEIDFPMDNIFQHIQKDFKQPKSKSVDFIDRVPAFLRPAAKKLATPKPVINQKKCVGCGKCAESCPQHTIDIVEKKAHIDYSKCINCFCCHEMCPVHVIDVKRFSLFNL